MTPLAILASSFMLWLAAHEAFFFAYHRALELPFTISSAFFTSLLSAWTYALVATLGKRFLRVVAVLVYTTVLALVLIDYAYFQVFNKFLPLSFSRIGSLNLPMFELLKDYLFLIPKTLVLGAFALLAQAVLYAAIIPSRLSRRAVRIPLSGGKAIFNAPGRSGWLATVGVTAQIIILSGAIVAADAYRSSLASSGKDPFAALADLGAFGYALAAERGLSETRAGNASVAALENSRTNVQVALDAMLQLAELSSPVSRESVALPSFKKPPHVIIYQMESVAAWPLEQEPSPMPFLESLMEKFGSVEEYVSNGCTTIDAEFVASCGFLPETNGPVSDLYANNDYRCLPSILKESGYATAIYHANDPDFWKRKTLAPAWGYDEMHFKPEIPFRDTDSAVFDRVVDSLGNATKPTLSYVIGFTSHSPHGAELTDYYKKVKHLDVAPYSAPLGETALSMEADESTTRTYLGFMTAVDNSLQHLFERLQTEKLAENTIVVAFGDHRYYDSIAPDALVRFQRYNRIPFLLYAPGLKAARLATVASHADIAPTLHHLISGQEHGLPKSFLGSSLFAAQRPAGAVTKCLGQATYYDGETIVSGDMSLGAMTVHPSTASGAAEMKIALQEVVRATDLALKRNEIGQALVPQQISASKKIEGVNVADTDGDGLSDLREAAIGTDRNKTDTDGDGYSDGVEAANGFNPNGPGRWVGVSGR